MKKVLAIMVLVAIAFIAWGFRDKAEVTYIDHVVKAGETLNGIAARYHSLNTKGYIDLDDYSMMVRVKNNKKHNLNRVLQVGDIVEIPVYTVRQ